MWAFLVQTLRVDKILFETCGLILFDFPTNEQTINCNPTCRTKQNIIMGIKNKEKPKRVTKFRYIKCPKKLVIQKHVSEAPYSAKIRCLACLNTVEQVVFARIEMKFISCTCVEKSTIYAQIDEFCDE